MRIYDKGRIEIYFLYIHNFRVIVKREDEIYLILSEISMIKLTPLERMKIGVFTLKYPSMAEMTYSYDTLNLTRISCLLKINNLNKVLFKFIRDSY